MKTLAYLLIPVLTLGAAAPVPATPPATVPTTRAAATTPLSGEALERELDARFGIWFVGDKLPASAKVTLPQKATTADALALVLAAAQADGYEILEVPAAPAVEGHLFQVRRAGQETVRYRYGADADIIALNDEGVGLVIPLKNMEARTVADELAPLASGTLTCNTRHNCLIVSDTSAKVRRLVEIVVKIDTPRGGKTPIEYRQLTHLDAADVAKKINARFAPPPATATTAPRTPAARLYADFDTRTNTVVLNGPADLLKEAVEMINQMEKEVAATAPATTKRGP